MVDLCDVVSEDRLRSVWCNIPVDTCSTSELNNAENSIHKYLKMIAVLFLRHNIMCKCTHVQKLVYCQFLFGK